MANKILQRTPLVIVGDLFPAVKFNVELYMAEADLTTEITLSPVSGIGSTEALKPIIGAKVVYKFTNAGPGANIVLDRAFNIDPQSLPFDPAPGTINIVTMQYDGSNFWACLSNTNPVPVPVPEAGFSRIGDFGWGEGVIVITTTPCEINLLDIEGSIYSTVSAFDMISSVHYLGTDTLVFTVDDMYNPGTPNSNLDPKLANRTYTCLDLGTQFAGIQVSELNGPLQSVLTPCTVLIDDPTNLCGA